MKTYIKLRRKGFNYYTDFTQKYLNAAFAEYSYYLTFRKEKAAFSVKFYWDDSPWFTFSADWLSDFDDEQTEQFAKHLAESFKTKYEIAHDFCVTGNSECIEYYLTADHNWAAVNEPPFIQEGHPKLQTVMYNNPLVKGKETDVWIQNCGGIEPGLTIDAISSDPPIELSDFFISYADFLQKGNVAQVNHIYPTTSKIVCNCPQTIRYTFPDFVFPEGVNLYSTKLTAKNKQMQHMSRCFIVQFSPNWEAEASPNLVLTVWADTVPDEKISVSFR